MAGLTLITATGGRPECAPLLAEYLARQTYRGPRTWIVLDDCDPPMPAMGADRVIRPPWRWQPGENTYAKNLALLLREARQQPHDHLLIIEDDEWYGPNYLAEMARALEDWPLVGEFKPRYYCVRTRTYRVHDQKRHRKHSCLCRTGLRRGRLWEKLTAIVADPKAGAIYDRPLWAGEAGRLLRARLSVGIKGMPGRPGIAGGHHGHVKYAPDPDLSVLRAWIGADADRYEGYHAPVQP